MYQVKTVKVATQVTEGNPHGYVIINESDFDEKIHELFEEVEDKVIDIEKATAKELKALLTKLEVAFGANAGIDKLRELAKAAQEKTAE